MQISTGEFVASFESGFAEAARLRALLSSSNADDLLVAAEITRLSESLRARMAVVFPVALALTEREAMNPVVRKTLEAAGLTRERLKQIFDAILSAYDAPETQA